MIDANFLIKLLAAGILAIMPFIIIWAKQISILQKILVTLSLILGILLLFQSLILTPRTHYMFIYTRMGMQDLSSLLQDKTASQELNTIICKHLATNEFSEYDFSSDLRALKEKIMLPNSTNETAKPSSPSEKPEAAQ